MDKKQIEVYNYFKQLYPAAIVLYHIGGNYVVIGDDAIKVAEVLTGSADNVSDGFEFPYDDVDTIKRLGDAFQLEMIDYRNDDGELDFPDIKRLIKEKYDDY